MNAVFTIVAKNYLPRALTLGDSVKAIHPDLPFFIFLSDELDGAVTPSMLRYPVVEAKDLGIARCRQMAFYYTILEFCCAIKPFCFEYLERLHGYEKIVYFDPDIYLYNSLEPMFAELSERSVMVTPHITDLAAAGDGAMPETSFLFVGAYNLGFVAMRMSAAAKALLAWWGERLIDRGFADFRDAQHVDQKWMDLMPGLMGEEAIISRYPGYNAAQWNIHERVLTVEGGRYLLNGEPLVFYHHTSFDPHNPARMAQRQQKFTLENRPEFTRLMNEYAAHLLRNGHDKFLSLPYAYARFDNGVNIFLFQRRMFRVISQSREVKSDPFSTGPGAFYDVLAQNGLIIEEKTRSEFVQADFRAAGTGVKLMKRTLRLMKSVLGIKRYYLLIRWLQNNTRPEEQVFLIARGLEGLK